MGAGETKKNAEEELKVGYSTTPASEAPSFTLLSENDESLLSSNHQSEDLGFSYNIKPFVEPSTSSSSNSSFDHSVDNGDKLIDAAASC